MNRRHTDGTAAAAAAASGKEEKGEGFSKWPFCRPATKCTQFFSVFPGADETANAVRSGHEQPPWRSVRLLVPGVRHSDKRAG